MPNIQTTDPRTIAYAKQFHMTPQAAASEVNRMGNTEFAKFNYSFPQTADPANFATSGLTPSTDYGAQFISPVMDNVDSYLDMNAPTHIKGTNELGNLNYDGSTPKEANGFTGSQMAGAAIGGLGLISNAYFANENLKLQKGRDEYNKGRDKRNDARVAKVQANYEASAR